MREFFFNFLNCIASWQKVGDAETSKRPCSFTPGGSNPIFGTVSTISGNLDYID